MSPDNGVIVHVLAEDAQVAEARAKLALARQRTRGALVALRGELVEQSDWRTWFRARPTPFLVAAFLVGFVLAGRRR